MTRAKEFRWNLRRFAGLLSLALLAELAVMAIFFAQADVADAQNAYITSGGASINAQGGFNSAFRSFAYSKSFSVSGVVGTVTWSIPTGSLPAGLSLGSSTTNMVSVTGTPTGSGASTYTLQAVGSVSGTVKQSFTTTVYTSTGTTTTLPAGQTSVNTGSTIQLTVTSAESDGVTNLNVTSIATYHCSGPGYSSISSAGLFTASGTPSSSGTTCTGAFDSQTSAAVTIVVSGGNPTFSTSTLPRGQQGFAYPEPGSANGSNTLACSGGTPPYTFAVASGTLPAGLILGTNGILSGTLSLTATTQSVTFKCTDSATPTPGVGTSASITITVATPTTPTNACAPTTITLNSTSQCIATANFSDGSTQIVTTSSSIVPGTPQQNSLSGVTSITVSVTVGAGLSYDVCARQGADNTHGITFTDSANATSAAWLAAGGQIVANNTAYAAHLSTCGHFANTTGITSVTATAAAGVATSNMGIIVYPLSGAANSSPIDGVPAVNGVTNAMDVIQGQNCGPLTTTNPTDALFCWQDTGLPENSFSIAGMSIPVTAFTSTTGRSAMGFQVVSSPQSAIQPAAQWTPTPVAAAGNIMFAVMAANGGGAFWSTDLGSIQNGTLLGSASGTAHVSFTYRGTPSNVVPITINAAQNDTSICINTAAPPSGGVCPAVTSAGTVGGSAVLFTAMGNITGASYTASGSWNSTNNTIASSNGNGSFTCNAQGSTQVTVSADAGALSGAATLNCGAPIGNQSMLPGCTYIGTGGCALPAGWTLVTQQDFECVNSHAVPANPACNQLPNNETNIIGGGGFQTAQNHTPGGTYSFGGTYGGDAAQLSWLFNQNGGGVGTITSIYLSAWNYHDPGGYFGNSDYQILNLKPGASYGLGAGTACNMGGNGQLFNNLVASTTSTEMTVSTEGAPGNGPCAGGFIVDPSSGNAVGPNFPVDGGAWDQWEMLITPNTTATAPTKNIDCTNLSPSTAGCGNGEVAMWKNGVKVADVKNVDLNNLVSGNPNYTNDPMIWVGGFITSFGAQNANGQFINGDPSNQNRCSTFSSPGVAGSCPGAQPGIGGPSVFHRYFDDIIALKQ